jgi:hypothetical protein
LLKKIHRNTKHKHLNWYLSRPPLPLIPGKYEDKASVLVKRRECFGHDNMKQKILCLNSSHMLDKLSLLFRLLWWGKKVNEVKTSNESSNCIIILSFPLSYDTISYYEHWHFSRIGPTNPVHVYIPGVLIVFLKAYC